ncbi:hypothetical protein [Bifidobacterium myosotis]|uniref:Uncharacterized protein n=1 Tax=Bifidobacterium myosotis TaxID=1630166 RepID=A0A5M9ZMQ5_9BIFI|nr:hypothetical protein [Bifidobacterium myosotis]KAA8828152.1 hypothetical protein EMO91_06845 [Bifidobacterium myosotis]
MNDGRNDVMDDVMDDESRNEPGDNGHPRLWRAAVMVLYAALFTLGIGQLVEATTTPADDGATVACQAAGDAGGCAREAS